MLAIKSPTKLDQELVDRKRSDPTQVLIEEARRRHRHRLYWSGALLLPLTAGLIFAVIAAFGGGSPATDLSPLKSFSRNAVLAAGTSVPATEVSRLQMLSPKTGLGLSPLFHQYLVATNDGGEKWSVAGEFPRGFIPTELAFSNEDSGYVLGDQGVVMTNNGGKSWIKVKSQPGSYAISLVGNDIWIAAQTCPQSMSSVISCSTSLSTYSFGAQLPNTTETIPRHEANIFRVGASAGYAIGGFRVDSVGGRGNIFFTIDNGKSWSAVNSPCQSGIITSSLVTSRKNVFLECSRSTATHETSTLFCSVNGGDSWQSLGSSKTNGYALSGTASGRILWQFSAKGFLRRSLDGGRRWSQVQNVTRQNVKGGNAPTIAAVDGAYAWYPEFDRGIYRTKNGRDWVLLK